MQNLISALTDYTTTLRDADRGDPHAPTMLADLWQDVERHARPQGLTAPQALRAYLRTH